jgi:hypothetical protein
LRLNAASRSRNQPKDYQFNGGGFELRAPDRSKSGLN